MAVSKTYHSKGIKVGDKVVVNFLKTGIKTKDGSKWATFNYNDQAFDKKTKKYITVTQYTIFINNPDEAILNNGDEVTINSITAFKTNQNHTDDNKIYTNVTLFCEVHKINQSIKEKNKIKYAQNNSNENDTSDFDFSTNVGFDDFQVDDIDFNI